MAQPPQFKYHIINVKSGTVLDLSGTNQTTISGWANNHGDNQEWYTEEIDPNIPLLAFKNVRYGKFASFSGAVRPGAPAVGTKQPHLWQTKDAGPGLSRLLVSPNSPFVLELSKGGDKANGTPVVIAREREGAEEQLWRFVVVKGA